MSLENLITLWFGLHAAFFMCVQSLPLLVGMVHLVERRGKMPQLHAGRQIDIATLLESMQEAVFLFDSAGKILEVNSAAERIFRSGRDEMKRYTAADIARFMSENVPQPVAPEHLAVNRALRGETVRQEQRTLALATAPAPLETLLSASPIRNDANEIVGALVIVRDVTELVTLQRRMAETEQHNAIGKMAAGLAHDFNNVLQTIAQAVAVLEYDQNRSSEERSMILRMVRNAVKRGTDIVAGVRQYLASGTTGSDLVDMNQVLEEAVELTRPLWQAARNISIVRQFQPVSRVRVNTNDLRRVFTNLIINALEAMPVGGTLTVGCEQKDSSVLAFVADTGEGIPPERQKKIFLPYYTTKRSGTGLGLATAQRAMAAQRGRVSFESKAGMGTKFVVELPVQEELLDKAA
ncbi:MAG TPA: ATP-binding protein [Clostridia bacterium]|nr:ATP-binding protein [Clostridia bacterium]